MWIVKGAVSESIYGRYDSLEDAEHESKVIKESIGIELVIERIPSQEHKKKKSRRMRKSKCLL